MTPELQQLPWDTRFFGYTVGRLDLHSYDETRLVTVLERARLQGFKLLYVFTGKASIPEQAMTSSYPIRLVDTKVTYSYVLGPPAIPLPELLIRRFSATDNVAQLYELAYQSGKYSRFRVDAAIGAEKFRALYRLWVDNSLSGQAADDTFVYVMDEVISGFVTVSKRLPIATIGLIATDEAKRGRGIGSALLNYVKHEVKATSAGRLEVATQKKNTIACRFYERNGFVVSDETNVYHIWL
ncbi:GNAT family N-acetyltransferase [Spirosoma fluminis]